MYSNIKSVFDDLASTVTVDKRLLKRVSSYVQGFLTKNEDHIAFFGDALIGVHPIRYTTEDKNTWFDEVLEVDEFELKREVHSLETVDPNHIVASDITNISMVWLVYAINTSSDIKDRERHRAVVEIISMMHYKFLSSLMAHSFPYPADKSIALATYAQLSKRFSLKVHGSWANLILNRAEDVTSEGSIHYETLTNFDDDGRILYVITDIQSRIREVFKNIRDIFHQVRDSDARITASSSTMDLDGDSVVKDQQNGYIAFKRYLHEVVQDKKGFIRDEVMTVVSKAVHTMDPRFLKETLEYISDNYGSRREKDIPELLDETLVHAFTYLKQVNVDLRDLPMVITKLRTIYISPRSTERSLLHIRAMGLDMVEKSVRSRNDAMKASVRTGLLLYIVLRTLTKSHYS